MVTGVDRLESVPPPRHHPRPDTTPPRTPQLHSAPGAILDAPVIEVDEIPPQAGDHREAVRAVAAMARLPHGHPDRPVARERAVTLHMALVEHLARRFADRGEPLDDLIQVGTIGLLKALDRYDPDHGAAFTSFAVPTIVGEIKRHFRDRGWAVRVPRRLQELGRMLVGERSALSQELGRAPTVAELSRRTGVGPEQVLEALESANAYATVPLEAPDGSERQAVTGGDDAALETVENREALRPLLRRLPARERRILALRFLKGMSQNQIADEVGISQMHVSRLLNRSLRELRTGLSAEV